MASYVLMYRRADFAQYVVDRRHGVRIANSERVQITIFNGNAYASIFLGYTYDRTCHWTVRRTNQPELEQFTNLSINVRLQCIRNTIRSHLTRNELGGGHYAVHGCVTEAWRVGEPVVEFVEEMKEFLTLARLEVCQLALVDTLTG